MGQGIRLRFAASTQVRAVTRLGTWLLAGALALPAVGEASSPDDAYAAEVTELVARYNAARDARDVGALADLLTGDSDQLVSSGEWRRGRDAAIAGMQRSSQNNPGTRTLTVETVRLIAPDVALADARYEISDPDGGEPRRMWSSFLAVRSDGQWRIAAIRNMLPTR